jgi:DUF4097 and DUF4098 domain-containing protein YvlB
VNRRGATPLTVFAAALAAGVAALLAARLGLSVTPAAPRAAGSAPAAATSNPVARPEGTRYYTQGRYLVQEINGTVPAAVARVRVDTQLGAVILRTAKGSTLGYHILLRAAGPDVPETRGRLDRMEISASRTGDLVQFTGTLPRTASAPRGLDARFEIALPAGVRIIDASTGAGDIEASGTSGTIGLVTQGGTISARDLTGPLTAETRGGRIDVAALGASATLITAGGDVTVGTTRGPLVVRSSGGDVRIGQVGADIRVETGGGSVVIERADGAVQVATSGGDIDVAEATGAVTAATAGGGIRVGRAGGGVRCETAAGPILLEGVGGAVRAVSSAGTIRVGLRGRTLGGDSDLQTRQGDVVVSLPDDVPMTIRALVDNPVGHPIQSDFPLEVLRELAEAGRPLEVGEARIGGGGPVLKLRTLNGRIRILKVKDGQGSKQVETIQY